MSVWEWIGVSAAAVAVACFLFAIYLLFQILRDINR